MEKPTEENGAPYEIDGNSRFDLSSGTWWATCSIKFKISIFLLASIFRVKRFILSRWSKTCWRNLIAEISASLIHSMAIDPPRQWPLGGSINRISVNFNFLVRNYIQCSDSCRITRVTVPLLETRVLDSWTARQHPPPPPLRCTCFHVWVTRAQFVLVSYWPCSMTQSSQSGCLSTLLLVWQLCNQLQINPSPTQVPPR